MRRGGRSARGHEIFLCLRHIFFFQDLGRKFCFIMSLLSGDFLSALTFVISKNLDLFSLRLVSRSYY